MLKPICMRDTTHCWQLAPTEHALKCLQIILIRGTHVDQIRYFPRARSYILSSVDPSDICKSLHTSDSWIAPGTCRNGCSQPSIT